MRRKRLFLALAAVLAASGLWLGWSAWRTRAFHQSGMHAGIKALDGRPKPGQMHDRPAPPDPSRRFTDFTPEQRVQFARKGHGPGG